MEHINLVYWDDVDNWGDFLSPYIIGKLSGLPVRHKKLYLLGRRATAIIREFYIRQSRKGRFAKDLVFL